MKEFNISGRKTEREKRDGQTERKTERRSKKQYKKVN
jgi:hypothetical protein